MPSLGITVPTVVVRYALPGQAMGLGCSAVLPSGGPQNPKLGDVVVERWAALAEGSCLVRFPFFWSRGPL